MCKHMNTCACKRTDLYTHNTHKCTWTPTHCIHMHNRVYNTRAFKHTHGHKQACTVTLHCCLMTLSVIKILLALLTPLQL